MKRNKFSLSHTKLLTCNMGELVPTTWFEVLPGDSVRQMNTLLIRVQPLLAPVMHPVRVRIHNFFVPMRLIWEDWEDFITGGPSGTSTPSYPRISIASVTQGTLHDYLGLPTTITSSAYSALPHRAYAKIFNEYYRDQDLVTELVCSEASGIDSTTNTTLQHVSWEKDYFTTCRGSEGKGTTVTIPLAGEAPIFGDNMDFDSVDDTANRAQVRDAQGDTANLRFLAADTTHLYGGSSASGTGELKADLSEATGVDINELRLALALQRYQEARQQYGSRYSEYLAYLGVTPDDSRIQRPQYLGGGKSVIQFSEVLSTDDDDSTNYAGKLRGHGLSAMRSRRYLKFFREHGIVMSLISVLPRTIYHSGVPRKFMRATKEQYYQKELVNIGEQIVTNFETYGAHSSPSGTFGYQARYDEYRSAPSGIAGEFNSTLNHWHMARIFAGDTALNSTFTNAIPTTRIYQSASTDQLQIMCDHKIQARRMLPNIAKPRTF